MRSFSRVAVSLLFVGSLCACGGSNAVDGGARIPSWTLGFDTNEHEDCPEGQIWFDSECRKQRGIIIDQKPHVLGIIIDHPKIEEGVEKQLVSPPPSFSDSGSETDSPVER